jgi:hypothetical protein
MEAEDAVEGKGEGDEEGGGTGDWMYLPSRQKGNGVRCRIRSTTFWLRVLIDMITVHILHGDQTTSFEME